MGQIKNYLMDKIERGELEYNPEAREYQSTKPKLTKFYTVVVEGMDTGVRFNNESEAQEHANGAGADAHVGIIHE